MPASTSRDSALRRMRVARWSSLNRLSSVSGFSSVRSSWSRNDSWRDSSTWSRRATLTNMAAIDPRSAACSCATCTVVALTSLNAVARRPTSSSDSTGISGTVMPGPSPGVAMRSTMRGRFSRIWAAASVRRRSGRVMRRASTRASSHRDHDGGERTDDHLHRVLAGVGGELGGPLLRGVDDGVEPAPERRDVLVRGGAPLVDGEALDHAVRVVDGPLARQLEHVAGGRGAHSRRLGDARRVLPDQRRAQGGVPRGLLRLGREDADGHRGGGEVALGGDRLGQLLGRGVGTEVLGQGAVVETVRDGRREGDVGRDDLGVAQECGAGCQDAAVDLSSQLGQQVVSPRWRPARPPARPPPAGRGPSR